MEPSHHRRERGVPARLVAVVAVAVLLAGCGVRVPHDEIVAAHRAGLVGETTGPNGDLPAGAGDPAAEAPAGVRAEPPVGSASPTGGASTGGAPATAGGSAAPTGASSAATAPGTASPARPGGVSASPSPAGRSQPTTAPPPPAAPPANPANRAPITIGHVGTYSGVVGAVLSGGLQTAQAWARSVNARGGLGGHPVKLITADDGGDPARNLSVVKNMVENQGVIAFVGNLVPLSVNGSISYLTDKGVPAVGGDLVDPNWHEHPILYPQGTWVNAIAAGTVKVGAEFSGKRRVGILYCSEAAACQNAAAVAKASAQKGESGTQLVYSAQVSLAQPDFTAECLQAQRANVEILSVFTDGNTIGRVAKSCAQQNFKPQYTTSSLAVVNSLQSIPELEGLAAPAFDFPWMATDTPAAQEYQQAMKTFAPGIEPSGATALVWTSGKLLEKAASALSATPSPLEIQRGLWALKDETLGGIAPPLTFTQGQPPGKASCYFVVRLVSGKWSAPQGSRTTCL